MKVGVPGRESLGEDKILNKAPSLKPLKKLRSKSCNIGVLTEAKAIKQYAKSMPFIDNCLVCGILGKSQDNCCFEILQKSNFNLMGCLCTISDRICDVIFQFSNLTADHKDGS